MHDCNCTHFYRQHMSRSFQPISDVINTGSRHKQQPFNEIYGEPENFLEIEVCVIAELCAQKLARGEKNGASTTLY